MTVEKPADVLAILGDEPDMRVYQYRHAHTGAMLYAMFPSWQADDMAWAPMVAEPVLLYAGGHWSERGTDWLARHLAQPEDTHHA
jgi:hypothetical protein